MYMSIVADKDTQVGFFFQSKVIKPIGIPSIKQDIIVPPVQTCHGEDEPDKSKRKSLASMKGSLKGASGIINFKKLEPGNVKMR